MNSKCGKMGRKNKNATRKRILGKKERSGEIVRNVKETVSKGVVRLAREVT